MKNRYVVYVYLCVALLALAFTISIAGYGDHNYSENFVSYGLRDDANTTAWWDTLRGELKLNLKADPIGSVAIASPNKIRIAGDVAYVLDFNFGLRVIDISDPGNLMVIGSRATSFDAYDFVVRGNYAFVAVDEGGPGAIPGGLDIIDVSDPTSPQSPVYLNLPNIEPIGVVVDGNYAFVATGSGGLVTVDITDPTSPSVCGSMSTPGHAQGIFVSGDYAFIGDIDGLVVADVSDPCNPVLTASVPLPGTNNVDIAVDGDYCYVSNRTAPSAVHTVDISDPTNPFVVTSYGTPGAGSAGCVEVCGNYLFSACRDAGVRILDIFDPANPKEIGYYRTAGNILSLAVAGEYIYVGSSSDGFFALDMRDPLVPPVTVGAAALLDAAISIDVSGNYAYAAIQDSGLVVINIENPTLPVVISSVMTPGQAFDVKIVGDIAYIADYKAGLTIVDIGDPSKPNIVTNIDPSTAWDDAAVNVAIDGDFAWVAHGYQGIRVFDVSDPTNPSHLVQRGTPGSATGIAIAGNYAYVTCYTSSPAIVTFDISDPANPTAVDTLSGAGLNPYNSVVVGDHLYVANGANGLLVLDISNAAHPIIISALATPGDARQATVVGDFAFLADFDGGLQVIDVSDPTTPTITTSYATVLNSRGITYAGEYVFLSQSNTAADMGGIEVLKVFEYPLDIANNIAQSTRMNKVDKEIVRAKFNAVQIDSFLWELSADGGSNWQPLSSGAAWQQFGTPGTELLWRSVLTAAHDVYQRGDRGPVCSSLDISWLFSCAVIDSIVDVPDDQGGWVRVHVTRSGYDFSGSASQIIGYNLYRRVDDIALVQEIQSKGRTVGGNDQADISKAGPRDAPFALDGVRLVSMGERYFVENDPVAGAAGAPPGVWEITASFYATQIDQYTILAPTLADTMESTITYSVHYLTAHSSDPSLYYASEPDSGYSVDNIAPAMPPAFFATYNTGSGNTLSWGPVPDNDLQYYKIYRGADVDFTTSPGTFLDLTTSTTWRDPEYDGWQVYYKVTAVDDAGNEGDAAGWEPVTAVDNKPAIPESFALHQNVPNPFNPTTTIHYDVPAGGGYVSMKIYDVAGRLVRTLVNAVQSPGEKSVLWNGHNDQGAGVATGVYFYRLTAPRYEQTRKMIMIQ